MLKQVPFCDLDWPSQDKLPGTLVTRGILWWRRQSLPLHPATTRSLKPKPCPWSILGILAITKNPSLYY